MNTTNQIYGLRQIETPRLIIRPVHLQDATAFNKSINNSIKLLQQWQAWAQNSSINTTTDFVQRGVFAWLTGGVVDFPMTLIHKADQKIIGASGYNHRSEPDNGLYEIGCWCDIDYQGQGLVTECTTALTLYALNTLKAKQVNLQINIANSQSIAVAKRCGYRLSDTVNSVPDNGVTGQPQQDHRYVCDDPSVLPTLSIQCQHHNDTNIMPTLLAWATCQLGIKQNASLIGSRVIVKTPWSCVIEINTGTTRAE